MSQVLLIDMDDTLYREASYVCSGFRAVADFLVSENNIADTKDQLVDKMTAILHREGRGQVFNSLLQTYAISDTPELIDHMVHLYRNHEPQITLNPGVYELLNYLKARHTLILVTDGLPLMQVKKVKALELDQIIDHIFYTWTYTRKPKPDSYAYPLQQMGLSPEDCIIIGDNPINDGQPAGALNIPFWQIYSERQTRSPHADRFFMSFVDIGPVLEEL